jgi:hypothetical protein
MEPNNYNGVHILSEAVIMGGISMYFYKKISELESTIEDLKSQITMQNNQLRYLLGGHVPQTNGNFSGSQQPQQTPLKIPSQETLTRKPPQKENFFNNRSEQKSGQSLQFNGHTEASIQEIVQSSIVQQSKQVSLDCENGVCRLVPRPKQNGDQKEPMEKKVVISKISKQIEFDRENMEPDHTSKVNTFAKFSPNPLLNSVTPRPSISASETTVENELEKILNDIDDE